jgi:hypothetical protein
MFLDKTMQPKVGLVPHNHKPGAMIQTAADPEDNEALQPIDVLIRIVITLLTPMFLLGADGNVEFARMAANETLRSYKPYDHASLIRVANIIAFGLATLGSLSISMQDDLPIMLVLRLRSNANALDRSADRNQRAVKTVKPAARPQPAPPPAPKQEFDDAAVQASVAEASRLAAEFRASTRTRPPAQPAPAQTAPIPASYRSQWAAAMAEVAAEDMAAIHNLPPSQRKEATVRAAILSSTAHSLLTGTPNDYTTMVRQAPDPVRPQPATASGV